MLIIPLTGKISLRNPPLITIGLILLNCFIFIMFQLNENRQYFEAERFYLESGLADIELNRYWEYKFTDQERESMTRFSRETRNRKHSKLYWEMRQDRAFMAKLEDGEIITTDDPEYAEWKHLRDTYTLKRSKVVSIRYGFKPNQPDVWTLFTHMFLHGGWGHLIGNMIFLWLVGCLLEMGCGRAFYLIAYILAGLGAVGLFWLGNLDATGPLVGASGAIAGLMGMLTLIYGMKKIKIFFSIGIYFNYLQMRAVFLLPLWLGIELYRLIMSENRRIAYLAHIGGLLSGAAIGFVNKKYLGFYKKDAIEPEPEDEISPLIEKALEQIAQLNMAEGASILKEVLAKDPNHVVALKHLFEIRKAQPQDSQFHEIARRLLQVQTKNKDLHANAVDTYLAYITSCRQPKLSANLYLGLAAILSNHGHPEKAEKILALFMKKQPNLPGMSSLLLKLANGYEKKGNLVKQQKCLRLICSRYAGSPEAQLAKSALKPIK